MFERSIACPVCTLEYPLPGLRFRCTCGGNLEVVFDYAKLKKAKRAILARPFGHARYLELYPVPALVSLAEGGTPLIRCRNLESLLGLNLELHFKNELLNPTGSFKDRGTSVEVAKAVQSSFRAGVCASTGNMGASVAAYCGVAGMRCRIFVPRATSPTKLAQIRAYGGTVATVPGDYSLAVRRAETSWTRAKPARSHRSAFLFGDYLYRREGTKSVGFEIAEQGQFDYVFCPIGNGNLISAIWKAFTEFRTIRMIQKRPRLAGIQAAGCDPVVRAFASGGDLRPLRKTRTVASAIDCANPLDGFLALRALRESDGLAGQVTDQEILRARELLRRHEGIFAEPAGAASVAGLLKMADRLEKGARVVCVITGHGLKDPREGSSAPRSR